MQAVRLSASSLYQRVKSLMPRLLLVTYSLFIISYFLFPSYHSHYRYYAKAVAIPGLLVLGEMVMRFA